MGFARFVVDQLLSIRREFFRIARAVSATEWQLENTSTGRIVTYTQSELESMYSTGDLTFVEPIAAHASASLKISLSDSEWEIAVVRRMYVVAVLDAPRSRRALGSIIVSVWEKLKKPEKRPDVATVIRWKNRYVLAGNDIHALADRNGGKGNRVERYSKEVKKLFLKAIKIKYLTRERKTRQDALDYAHLLVKEENKLRPAGQVLPFPGPRYIQSLIDQIPVFERYVARFGHDAAVKHIRYVGAGIQSSSPLQRAEIDHTILDLLVIDDETLLPLGRPYITCCIDTFTRCILGIYVGFTPPSFHTVACCLKHAFMPKLGLKELYGLENDCIHSSNCRVDGFGHPRIG